MCAIFVADARSPVAARALLAARAGMTKPKASTVAKPKVKKFGKNNETRVVGHKARRFYPTVKASRKLPVRRQILFRPSLRTRTRD